MTTYTVIANADIDQDSRVTQPLMQALRDNPAAIAEGAAGAPSILEGAVALGEAGGPGTYTMLYRTAGDATRNTVYPGTQLAWDSGGTDRPSGTWRAMQGGVGLSQTLYLRVT